MQIKFHSEMVIFNSKQKNFKGDFKKIIKDNVLLTVLNTWACKLIQILNGKMLIIFPLNWIQPILSFSKWENVSPKILRSIYFTIFTSLASELQHYSTNCNFASKGCWNLLVINLGISIPDPYSKKTRS